MEKKIIKNDLLAEEYYEFDHSSGLKIFVMPKKDYEGAFAMFGTKYGSVDTCFKRKGDSDFTKVPEGIAHFLEHKLFESEDLDAFARFEKTGASANAFTSFDRTCYIFQCSDNFDQSLEILLDFVKAPYFTQETVDKEQGIIGQEIKMYQDSPDWQVIFNLLRCIYQNNPVRIDIAGTVESIAEINAELLYSCYNTFYNNSNMALAVVGNVTAEQVIAVADKVLKKEEKVEIEQIVPEEPENLFSSYYEEKMEVDIPKFAIGFKEKMLGNVRTPKEIACTNILLDLVAGKVSPLYEEMLSGGLINKYFGYEYFEGRGFSVPMYSGESSEPEKVKEKILERIALLKENGISETDFEVSRKRLYGLQIRAFNDVDDLAGNIVESYFRNSNLFSSIEAYREISKDDVEKILRQNFSEELVALSVIK
ncbi:MAG: insulinase family protein [Clostridia bacterium]|nr:insulinase family protein [Clostridia bacterium]